ncbi:hypothetical protein IAQ61_002008 [Plenodomus lingam]|nr:hypothetical protein IAQ61_002008 [Plenodomus lingam]
MPLTTATLPTARQFVTQLLNSLSALSLTEDAAAASVAVGNPLQNASDQVKKQFLALQVLFPNEFIPALDLLDRRLVTRFHICNADDNNEETNNDRTSDTSAQQNHPRQQHPRSPTTIQQDHTMTDFNPDQLPSPDTEIPLPNPNIHNPTTNTIYYVQSAAPPRPTRFSTSIDTTIFYQVRLTAWNCSCPAFAFNAFPADISSIPNSNTTPNLSHPAFIPTPTTQSPTLFGGVSLDMGMPPVCKHLLACVLAEKCDGLFGRFVCEKKGGVGEAAGWAAGWGE